LACYQVVCYQLRRTNDEGAQFTYLNLPRTTSASGSSTGDLKRLFFANPLDGYALMGSGAPTTLEVTHDGAQSSHREVIADSTTILGFSATRSELFAVVAQCSTAMVCKNYRLARSSLTART